MLAGFGVETLGHQHRTPRAIDVGVPRQDEGKEKEKLEAKIRKETRISNDTIRTGLSHFVAPLYVAPSTTPSNATPEASFLGGQLRRFWGVSSGRFFEASSGVFLRPARIEHFKA